MTRTKKPGIRVGACLPLMVAVGALIGCTPSADERCDEGFVWDGASHTCLCEDDGVWDSDDRVCRPRDTDTDTGTGTGHDAGNGDGGADSGDTDTGTEELPAGQGDDCVTTDSVPCPGEADYCAVQPGSTQGYCTMQGCVKEPADDCPTGFRCCYFTISPIPDFCATEADFTAMGAMCEGEKEE